MACIFPYISHLFLFNFFLASSLIWTRAQFIDLFLLYLHSFLFNPPYRLLIDQKKKKQLCIIFSVHMDYKDQIRLRIKYMCLSSHAEKKLFKVRKSLQKQQGLIHPQNHPNSRW